MRRIAGFGVIFVVGAVLSHPLYAQDGGGAEAPQDWQAVARMAIAESGCAEELDHLSQYIDEGKKFALLFLGDEYETGSSCVPKNPARAAELYRIAVDNGLEEAMPLLGYMYLNGLGVPRDVAQAQYWFKRTVLWQVRSIEEIRLSTIKSILGRRGVPEELKKELQWVREVEEGDAARQFELALQLRDGAGLPQDREAAFEWARQAADKGLVEVSYELAQWYISGAYGEKDAKRGLSWLEEAARADYVPAQRDLGLRLATGEEVKRNPIAAYVWLSRAQAGGADVTAALRELDTALSDDDKAVAGEWMEDPKMIPPSYLEGPAGLPGNWTYLADKAISAGDCVTGLDYIRQAREAGHRGALLRLGVMHETGECLPEDPAKAAELYREAVENGIETAQPLLGYMYLNGLGVPRDVGQARYWFKRTVLWLASFSEEERFAWLEFILGHRGIPAELKREVTWIGAIEEGDAARQLEIALQLRDGDGLPQDRELAFRWARQAADKGLAEAAYELAQWHISGAYGEKDVWRGLLWFKRAARAGHLEAQKELGLRFASGEDVKQDNREAYTWLLHAREGGADVAEALAKLDRVISPEDKSIANFWFEERFYFRP